MRVARAEIAARVHLYETLFTKKIVDSDKYQLIIFKVIVYVNI